MNYSTVDVVLQAWALRHGLHVSTRYRDDEVRSIAVVDDAGSEYQIFLTAPDASGQMTVIASKLRGPKNTLDTNVEQLSAALEDAYKVVEEWIHETGHTRTPVL